MIAATIEFVLRNLPAFMFVLALAIATLTRSEPNVPLRYLNWLLLLSVGFVGIWAGIFHIFFPTVASAQIGWAPSPFETEIGIADAASGVVAVAAFWRSLAFKAASVLYTALFNFGVAAGHVYQAVTAHNFSPDNFGLLLLLTVVQMVLLPVLLIRAQRAHSA